MKVRLNSFHDLVIFIYDLCFTGLVYEDSADFHLKGWGLQGLGEVVGRSGDIVELWAKAIVDVEGNAAVEAVINLFPIPLRELIWIGWAYLRCISQQFH